MKITRAIEILEEDEKGNFIFTIDVSYEAVRLGKEALKEIARWRRAYPHNGVRLLPGETEE